MHTMANTRAWTPDIYTFMALADILNQNDSQKCSEVSINKYILILVNYIKV